MSKKPKIKKPSWWEEFTTFAVKGNAMDLAVGTIIGAAFGTITKSVTNDLIMPVVNIFLGGTDFSDAKLKLPRMPWVEPKFETIVDETGAEIVQEIHNYLTYGNLISAIINFMILALVVFFLVKGINKLSELIDQARETNDQNTRADLYEQAMGYVLDLAVELPVYQRQVLYAYNSKVIDASSMPTEINPYTSPLDHIWELKFAE